MGEGLVPKKALSAVSEKASEFDPFEHPNMQDSDKSDYKANKINERLIANKSDNEDELAGAKPYVPEHLGCLSRCIFILDKHILKPMLVHNYSVERVNRDNEFFDEFEKHGDELREKAILHIETNSEKNSPRIRQ